MNKNKEKKDILNYESDYGKDLHEKTLMEDVRKKEIKKYEKDHEKQFHERKDSKERTNIYVENLNIDNSNYGNNINPTVQGNLDLNMDWSIKSSEPLYSNNGLQLPKSNNIKEEEIKNSKIYKDMENNYKEVLNKLKEKESFINKYEIELEKIKNDKNKLIKFKNNIIDKLLEYLKGKELTEDLYSIMKIIIGFKGDEIDG